MRRLQRLHDQTAHWKAKLASNANECEERNRALKEEKEAIGRHFQVPRNTTQSALDYKTRRIYRWDFRDSVL